jgi:uncharacterized protein (DUF4415 family)
MSRSDRRFRDLRPEEEARIQQGIAEDPDNPELTTKELASMRPFREVFPEMTANMEEAVASRDAGADAGKIAVTLRLDPDVVEAFKASGDDWRNRMATELRKAAGL